MTTDESFDEATESGIVNEPRERLRQTQSKKNCRGWVPALLAGVVIVVTV